MPPGKEPLGPLLSHGRQPVLRTQLRTPRCQSKKSGILAWLGRQAGPSVPARSSISRARLTQHLTVRKAEVSQANPARRGITWGPPLWDLPVSPLCKGFSTLIGMASPSCHPEEVCPFHRGGKWRFVSQWHVTLDTNYKHTIKGLSGHFEIPSS